MPSPYSSIDASTVESNETMEIQRLRISREEIGKRRYRVNCEISREDL